MKDFITKIFILSWLPDLYVINSLEHQQPDNKPNQSSSISNKTLIDMVKYTNSAVDTKKSFLNNKISFNKTMENNEHTSVRIGKRELLVLLYTAKVLTLQRLLRSIHTSTSIFILGVLIPLSQSPKRAKQLNSIVEWYNSRMLLNSDGRHNKGSPFILFFQS